MPLLKENTQNDYMLYILRFHKIIGDKKAINIVKEDIQSFVDWIRGKGLSASSIQNHLAAISAVFTYGVKTGVIEDNPVRKFDKSYVGKSKERIRFLIKDEYKLLLENCSYELLQQAMILAVETGLRKSELMSLKWSDQIDFRKKEITVFYTKNKKHRTIPISPIAFEVLKIIYKNKKKYERLNNKICDYVFFNFNTWKRIKSFKKSFATAKKRADIEDFRWHDFRHTFATWGLKGWFTWQKYPMDLYKLQRWLGHSDIKTTQRYAHLEIQDLHSLIDYSVVIQWEGVKWSEIKIRKSQYKTL
ncbi:MAG: tyrosine-type recombinase/integrase [Alphaproteobacteria bacterium]|nr:tyrosine-type recombinase/integrase [Alphaproteobacteria bacterium]